MPRAAVTNLGGGYLVATRGPRGGMGAVRALAGRVPSYGATVTFDTKSGPQTVTVDGLTAGDDLIGAAIGALVGKSPTFAGADLPVRDVTAWGDESGEEYDVDELDELEAEGEVTPRGSEARFDENTGRWRDSSGRFTAAPWNR